MALTFALLHAADRVSWLAILRAPWCGLTLAIWTRWRARSSCYHLGFPASARRRLSDDGRSARPAILPVLEQALAERGRRPLRDWVERVDAAGRPRVRWKRRRTGRRGGLFRSARRAGGRRRPGRLRMVPRASERTVRAARRERRPALQLMTIHKAKGLEFDTVIVPGLGAIPAWDEQRLLLWLEHRGELLLAADRGIGRRQRSHLRYLGASNAASPSRKPRACCMSRRRARGATCICWARGRKQTARRRPEERSFLKLLWPASANNSPIRPRRVEDEHALRRKTIRRLPATLGTFRLRLCRWNGASGDRARGTAGLI